MVSDVIVEEVNNVIVEVVSDVIVEEVNNVIVEIVSEVSHSRGG